MDLDTLMITVFCWVDDILESLYQGQPLRQRGPKPALCDAEVLTMEVVGEYLGQSRPGPFPVLSSALWALLPWAGTDTSDYLRAPGG